MAELRAVQQSAASPAEVWAVLVDVEDWPTWTASMKKITRLDDGVLRVGSTARVEQPRMRPMAWEVTTLEEGVEFTWRTRNPGIVTTGRHVLVPHDGGTRIELSAFHEGVLAPLVRVLTDKRVRSYVAMEAAGLKQAAEARG